MLLLILTALALAPRGLVHRAFAETLGTTDFRAFYCAARVARQGEDPYLALPLERCETHDAGVPKPVPGSTTLLDPAPQPGYDFALLEPLSVLPFFFAAALWNGILAACVIFASWLICRLTNAPLIVILVSFVIVEGYETLPYGQLSPVPIAAMCLAAYFLRAKRPVLAAASGSLALFEPHLGLPLCAALFIWQPKARIALIAMMVLLAVLSFAAIGAGRNLEYLTQVLPAHQISGLDDPTQYSLTWLLHQLRIADGLALSAGSASYAVMVLLSVGNAGRLARTVGEPAALALFPPAACTLFGPFIHIQQIGAALPFAIYFSTRVPAHRVLASISALTLALNWPATKYLRLNVLELLVLVTLGVFATRRLSIVHRTAILAATIVGYALFAYAAHFLPQTQVFAHLAGSPTRATHYNPALASTQMIVSRELGSWKDASWQEAAGKLPTWLALTILVSLGLGLARSGSANRSPEARTSDPLVLV